MSESLTLLAEYAENGSEAAFRELVGRYIDFVYSAACRMADQAPHLAEDVTQIVFTDLAAQARKLPRDVRLGGWLHRHTCFVAAKIMRGERRRRRREQQAVTMNSLLSDSGPNLDHLAPVLDDAINRLGAEDRTAILLRYFEDRDLRSVGAALGRSDEAARKRIDRALDKLRVILERRGAHCSSTALGAGLAATAVKAAPPGLANSIAGGALASAAAVPASFTILKIMAATKLKIGALTAIVAASIVTTLFIERHAHARQQEQEQALQIQRDRLSQLEADRRRLAGRLAGETGVNDSKEMDRLRQEAQSLRQTTNDLASLQDRIRALQTTLARSLTPWQEKAEAIERITFAKQAMVAFYIYAQNPNGQFPTNFAQVASILPQSAQVDTNDFDIVYTGSRDALTNPASLATTIVLAEREARQTRNGRWQKAYAFADGHSELRVQDDDNFDEWERARIVPGPATP